MIENTQLLTIEELRCSGIVNLQCYLDFNKTMRISKNPTLRESIGIEPDTEVVDFIAKLQKLIVDGLHAHLLKFAAEHAREFEQFRGVVETTVMELVLEQLGWEATKIEADKPTIQEQGVEAFTTLKFQIDVRIICKALLDHVTAMKAAAAEARRQAKEDQGLLKAGGNEDDRLAKPNTKEKDIKIKFEFRAYFDNLTDKPEREADCRLSITVD